MGETFRELSRKHRTPSEGSRYNRESFQTGALLRIADATEVMAKNWQRLEDERDRYKRWYQEERETSARLYRRISALRGVITKLKRRLDRAWEVRR